MLLREFAQSIKVPYSEAQRLVANGVLVASTYMRGKRRFVLSEVALKELEACRYFDEASPKEPGQPTDPTKQFEEWEARGLDTWMSKEKFWKAKQAELEYRKAAGDLIDLKSIRAAASEILAAVRKNILAIPTKARTHANLSEAQTQVIDELITTQLKELDRELGQLGESTL